MYLLQQTWDRSLYLNHGCLFVACMHNEPCAYFQKCYIHLDADLANRASLFFESLAKSGTGSSRASASASAGASATNPVYNLLPDMLSTLMREKGLVDGDFQEIMKQLLQYVKVTH